MAARSSVDGRVGLWARVSEYLGLDQNTQEQPSLPTPTSRINTASINSDTYVADDAQAVVPGKEGVDLFVHKSGSAGNNRSGTSDRFLKANIPPNHYIANHTTYFSQSRPMAIPGCFRQKIRSAWCLAMAFWLAVRHCGCGCVDKRGKRRRILGDEWDGWKACGQPKQMKRNQPNNPIGKPSG